MITKSVSKFSGYVYTRGTRYMHDKRVCKFKGLFSLPDVAEIFFFFFLHKKITKGLELQKKKILSQKL